MVEINYTVAESLASGAKPTDCSGASGRHQVTGTCQKKSKIQDRGGKKHREEHKNCQKGNKVKGFILHCYYGCEFVALAPLNVESGRVATLSKPLCNCPSVSSRPLWVLYNKHIEYFE